MGVIYYPYTLRKFACSQQFICELFHLISVVRRSLGLGPEKVVIAYKTLLIIAETDALEIPKLFVVFLWLFRH